jgi:hypothetical protein
MPTPFTHLEITQRLLKDPDVPRAYRDLLSAHHSAFQLGNIVADARIASGVGREVTHFYAYNHPITEHPWHVMLNDHPILQIPHDDRHLVFLAGYVTHLATDEAWALKMVRPNFSLREWEGVDRIDKFITLHLILSHIDERDEAQLDDWQSDSLAQCMPDDWLPFMSDSVLCSWRDLIATQIAPTGTSQTLAILGKRLALDPTVLRNMLDSPQIMFERLWQHVPQVMLATTERQMYAFTRAQLCHYLTDFS